MGNDTEQQVALYGTIIIVVLFYVAICLGLNTAGIMHMTKQIVPNLEEDSHSELTRLNHALVLKQIDMDEKVCLCNDVVGLSSLPDGGWSDPSNEIFQIFECAPSHNECMCFGCQTALNLEAANQATLIECESTKHQGPTFDQAI